MNKTIKAYLDTFTDLMDELVDSRKTYMEQVNISVDAHMNFRMLTDEVFKLLLESPSKASVAMYKGLDKIDTIRIMCRFLLARYTIDPKFEIRGIEKNIDPLRSDCLKQILEHLDQAKALFTDIKPIPHQNEVAASRSAPRNDVAYNTQRIAKY